MTTSTPEERLAALGLTLPAVPTPMANYVPYRLAGNLLFLSGQGPKRPDGSFMVGRLGKDASVEQGYEAARLTGLQLFAVAKAALGDLSRVEAVVKLLGMVNAEPDFGDHPKVINGCSDLMVEVLGEAGRHARSAVGMGSLPNRIMVEIEAILQISQKETQFRPETVIAYAMRETRSDGESIIADGAAFHSAGQWYNLVFKCRISARQQKVSAFEFAIGAAIPERDWASHDLPRGAMQAADD